MRFQIVFFQGEERADLHKALLIHFDAEILKPALVQRLCIAFELSRESSPVLFFTGANSSSLITSMETEYPAMGGHRR